MPLVGSSSNNHFIPPLLNAFLALCVWQSGDTSCSLLAVQKTHVIAYTTGPTCNHRKAAWIPLFKFGVFFWATLFLSFCICEFPPFENASFPWISLSLHISTFITFPLLGLFLLWPCPFPIPSHLFYIFLCLPLIHKALAISHLLCLTLSTVQKTCWTERAGTHLTSIASADEN